MASERKIEYKGKEVNAVTLDFQTKSEAWSQYSLEDGTNIKMKVILLDVKRIEGEYNADGNPVYQIQAQYIMGVEAAEGLRKKS